MVHYGFFRHFNVQGMMMIRFATFAAAALLTAGSAQAVVITGQLFNTGAGLPAGNGRVDANYTITAATHPGAVIGVAATTYVNGNYAATTADSRWIAFPGNISAIPLSGNAPTGFYDLTTSFSLAGFNALTANITGAWGADNQGEIFLNGASTGITLLSVASANYRTLRNFSIASGFISGLNTMTLRVNNNGGPTAGRFDNLVLSADALTAVIPEPASWAMLIAGFGLVGAAARRRRSLTSRAVA